LKAFHYTVAWGTDMLIAQHRTVIGASLSEPHTSVTALRTCMCRLACLRLYTV